MRRFSIVFLFATFCALLSVAVGSREPAALDGFERFVDEDGAIRFSPADLRDLRSIGSWFVPEGDASGFHLVYTQPEAIDAFRRSGSFRDGTVLVKEIRSHRTANYTTGNDVALPTEVRQWFVMIKDTQGRFVGNPLWAHSWGWALFMSEAPGRNVATDFQKDCLGCHLPARATDWVYVEGYPALREPTGEIDPSSGLPAGPPDR